MEYQWQGENLRRLSRESGIGLGSVVRLKEQRTSVGLDVLEKLAKIFGLQPWHLLTPDLDPANPPVIHLNQKERELYQRLSAALEELTKLDK